ncbi:MAG: flagellar hook-length control protein FliK [Candidatus Brocadiaceae bacterium]|uniref:flagellar hook-length control protein FliK n=1 Tax=Candidatus Wunengus sp. YC61 TaxID=3367698 RepID=UPI002715A16A|nr:flagellar hook-length control protein FliK [Candidatus Brocadiaceae bacterium]
MPETTVGLPDNNLFGNLIASTRPSASNPGSQTLNINSIQSDTKIEDVEDIENADNIPFQEILGQHIFNLNIHNTPNSPVPNTPAVESANIIPAPEPGAETNSSLFHEQILTAIQPVNILQKTFTPYPESTIQDFGNNLSPHNGETAGNANLNIYNPFPNAHNGNPPTSPFVPLSQRESKWGFGERTGVNVLPDKLLPDKLLPYKLHPDKLLPGKQTPDKLLIETYNTSSIFSTEKSNVNAVDEMDKPFIPDMDVRNTLPKTDTLKLHPLKNPETLQVSGESSINNTQQLDLYSSDSPEININELPETYKQLAQNISPENKNSKLRPVINNSSHAKEQLTENGLSKIQGTESSKQDISSISQTNEEWNLFDSHTQKQNTSDTVSFDAHIPKSNNGTPFSLDSQTTVNNAQSNGTDFQQNTKASPNSATALFSSLEDAKTINHVFHSNDMSNVGHTHENIMEQIFQKIRITTHGDRSEIKLSLNPPELGNVKIHFSEENDEIKAIIYVESAEVKAAIENKAHHLKESAASNGIEIHKLEVYIQYNDAHKQASIENFTTNNPHHQNHTFSQNGFDEDRAGNEENVNDQQIETPRNTSNLIVDYII